MAELADAMDLGSIVNRRAGSNPVIRTSPMNFSASWGCFICFFVAACRFAEKETRGNRHLPVPACLSER